MVRAAAWMTGLVPDAVERQVRGGFLYGDHLSLCGQRPRQRGCCSACKLRSDPQKPGGGSRKSSALEGKEGGRDPAEEGGSQVHHLQRECIGTGAPGTAWGLVSLRGQ